MPDTLTREAVLALPARERDSLVVEKVMGWQVFPYLMPEAFSDARVRTYCPPGVPVHVSNIRPVPSYSTDAAADYEVLEKMRQTQGKAVFLRFADELWMLLQSRPGLRKQDSIIGAATLYHPGDYALASLLALCG